jgi:hypothetical protein
VVTLAVWSRSWRSHRGRRREPPVERAPLAADDCGHAVASLRADPDVALDKQMGGRGALGSALLRAEGLRVNPEYRNTPRLTGPDSQAIARGRPLANRPSPRLLLLS